MSLRYRYSHLHGAIIPVPSSGQYRDAKFIARVRKAEDGSTKLHFTAAWILSVDELEEILEEAKKA